MQPHVLVMPIKLAVFDFDRTLSAYHVFGALAGTSRHTAELEDTRATGCGLIVQPPHARTEHGQLVRLAELDASPEFQATGGFAVTAFGGQDRVVSLQTFFAELGAAGVECLICTRGLVGPVRRCLEKVGLLHFFTRIYGKICTYYGGTEYDAQTSAASMGSDVRFLGSSEDADWESKPLLIARCLQERALQGHEAVFIDDDLSEVQAAMGVCNTIHVQGNQGMSQHEFVVLRNIVAGAQTPQYTAGPLAATPQIRVLQQPQMDVIPSPSRSAPCGQVMQSFQLQAAQRPVLGPELSSAALPPVMSPVQQVQPSSPIVLSSSFIPGAAMHPAVQRFAPFLDCEAATQKAQSEDLDVQVADFEARLLGALRAKSEAVRSGMLEELLKEVDVLQYQNESLWRKQETKLKGWRRGARSRPSSSMFRESTTGFEAVGSQSSLPASPSEDRVASMEHVLLETELIKLHELVHEREILDLEATCDTIVQHRSVKEELDRATPLTGMSAVEHGSLDFSRRSWHSRRRYREEQAAAAAATAHGVLQREAAIRELELAEQLRVLGREQAVLEDFVSLWNGDVSAYAQSV